MIVEQARLSAEGAIIASYLKRLKMPTIGRVYPQLAREVRIPLIHTSHSTRLVPLSPRDGGQ